MSANSGIASVASIPGAALSVPSITELQAYDITGLTIGSQIFTVETDERWTLLISSAGTDATHLPVAGTTGMKWISHGSETGFVTFDDLSSTDVVSGASLIGVNANGGMFSEADLQNVLQEDVVLKAVLAATDGTGGAALVGVQDSGGWFTQTNVETVTQALGASRATDETNIAANTAAIALRTIATDLASTTAGKGASLVGVNDTGGIITATQVEAALQEIFTSNALKQTKAAPSQFTMATGQVLSGDLSDAGTNAASAFRTWTHQTSGTAAAGFGSTELSRLENASGTMKDAIATVVAWVTATNAAEDASLTIQAMRGGTLTTLGRWNGKDADGSYPLEISAVQSGLWSLGFTANGNQEIQKATGGDLGVRAFTGKRFYVSAANFQAFFIGSDDQGGFPDIVLGRSAAMANANVDGFVYLPQSETTGVPTGTPVSNAGAATAHHAATLWNRADKKLWLYDDNANTWNFLKAIATAFTVGASLTNNVTAGGTTNTVDNIVAAPVDTGASSLTSTRNAVYQLTLKLANLELACKAAGIAVT